LNALPWLHARLGAAGPASLQRSVCAFSRSRAPRRAPRPPLRHRRCWAWTWAPAPRPSSARTPRRVMLASGTLCAQTANS
jgi:hypothetical protein